MDEISEMVPGGMMQGESFFFFFPLLILWRMGFGWSEEELYPPWCSGLSPLGYSVCGVDRFVCDAINHFAV